MIGGLLVLLMVAVAGCDDSEPETTVGPTASPQTILRAAREATDIADSYHLEMDFEMKATADGAERRIFHRVIADIRGKDLRLDVSTNFPVPGHLGPYAFQLISVDDVTYVTNPETGEWEVGDDSATSLTTFDFTDEDFIAGIRELSVEGIDTLDNVDTYRTAGVLSAESSAASSLIGVLVEGWQGELKVEYWVGVDDSLIRKFTIGGELESNGKHRAFVSMIVGLSDFGAEFIIEVPELDLNSTATPLLTPTPIARPTASSANTPTPEPTATATPDVAKTPVSSSGVSPRPTVAPTDGLWAGELVPEPGQTGISLPWLALRVRTGNDPDEDLWRLESGPWPNMLPPVSLCSPQRRPEGWELSSCTGITGDLTAFIPAEGDGGLEIAVQGTGFTASGTLTRIAPKDELRSTDNVTLLWHQPGGGIHTDIWADDGLVFAPRFDGVIEIMAAEDGKIIGQFEGWGAVMDVKARGGFLYAATALLGLLVLDISDPGTPELIGHFEAPATSGDLEGYTSFHNIFLSPDGRLVYATNYSTFPKTELLVIDVSDPAAPTEAGRFSISTDTSDFNFHATHDVNVLEVNGRLIAFLNYLSAGLWILDVTDPAAISTLGSIVWDGIFSHSGWPFSLEGRLYYAHNSEGYDRHMTILDVTDPAKPNIVSRFATRQGISVHNVQVVDGMAYISYYIDGLRVVDLRDPEMPEEIAHFDTVPDANERGLVQGAFGVRVIDGGVYISDMESGVYAFQVDVD